MTDRIRIADLRADTHDDEHLAHRQRRVYDPGRAKIVYAHDEANCELCALVEAIEAAHAHLPDAEADDVQIHSEWGVGAYEERDDITRLRQALARFDFDEPTPDAGAAG